MPPATDRVGRWQQDIEQLARELPERYVDSFIVVSREAFLAEANELRASVPSLDDPGVVAGMMGLVALLNLYCSLGGQFRRQLRNDDQNMMLG